MNTTNTNVRKYKQRKRSEQNGTFYEHDTRHVCNKLRSTVSVINETHLNNVQFRTQNKCQAKFGNVNKLRKKLLKQQQQIRMQLQALQKHSCFSSIVCSNCLSITSYNTKVQQKSINRPKMCTLQSPQCSLRESCRLVNSRMLSRM